MKRLVAQLAVAITAIVMAVPASADDGIIAKQIIAKLNQHKQSSSLKGFDLGVQVDKGTVTMMGQVASSEQAMLALDVARRVPGVKLVVNDLYVNQTAKPQTQPTLAVQPAAAQQPVQAPVPAPAAIYQQQLAQQQLIQSQQLAQQQLIQSQQRLAQQRMAQQHYTPQYNATGAVGSSVAHQRQRAVPFAQSNIRPASAHGPVRPADYVTDGGYATGGVVEGGYGGAIGGEAAMPNHAWPSYASSPNYGAVSYPEQYSATAWPYIGPFYPYPQVPLGWRKVSLEWDDGWWFLDFTKK